MRTLPFIVIAALAVTSSCSKNADKLPALAGTWSIASLTELAEGEADKNLLDTWDNCLTDNVYIMKEDKTYLQKDLGTLCGDTARNYVGVWQLDGNMLSFDKFTGDIEELNDQQLIVTYRYSMMGINTIRRAIFNKR